ncbi:DUF2634 domain-containing protein [Brevibacillus laterosporus]|uniref:DUF2634 domain-containing protein n=1 Tax=Brevibacillus laterosporus TaxID=1465 RepID=UPI0035A60A6B
MFPQLEGTDDISEDEASPIPWTYKIDWTTMQFIKGMDGRYLKTSTYAEYVEETAKKILHTKRFHYLIYSEQYGVDFLDDVGKMRSVIGLPVVKLQAEEALEAHPEIERAEVTDIKIERKLVIFSLQIEGLRGKTKVVVDIWQR